MPGEAGDLIYDVSRLAFLQPGRHSVGALTGLLGQVGGHAGLLGSVGHRTEFFAERTQTARYPFLLGSGLFGELTSGLLHQLLDLVRRFGGHLPGLLARDAGDVFPSVARRFRDLTGLIFRDIAGGGLPTLRAGFGDPSRVPARDGLNPGGAGGIAALSHVLPFVFR